MIYCSHPFSHSSSSPNVLAFLFPCWICYGRLLSIRDPPHAHSNSFKTEESSSSMLFVYYPAAAVAFFLMCVGWTDVCGARPRPKGDNNTRH